MGQERHTPVLLLRGGDVLLWQQIYTTSFEWLVDSFVRVVQCVTVQPLRPSVPCIAPVLIFLVRLSYLTVPALLILRTIPRNMNC